MQAAAVCVTFADDRVPGDCNTGGIRYVPGVKGDPSKRSVITRRDPDRVVGNDRVLSAKVNNANIRWIDDRVIDDRMPRAYKSNPIGPAAVITIIIRVDTPAGVHVVSNRIDGHIPDGSVLSSKSQA